MISFLASSIRSDFWNIFCFIVRKLDIVYSKLKMKSYFFEPAVFLLRGTIKAFIHDFMIYNYSAQIISLFIIDIPFVVLCLCYGKNFRNKLVLALVTSYFVGFMLFDLYFVMEFHTKLTAGYDRELIGFILCCVLGIVSLLLCFVFFVSALVEACKLIKNAFRKNKISSVRR